MNPAEEAVVRYALGKGYIQETHLAQARQEQAARAQRGQPSELLPLLAAFLAPAQVQELRQVYLSATQSGLRSPTVHPSQVGQITQPGMVPPRPPTSAGFSRAQLHPTSASGRIPMDHLPDSGEKTIQLSGPTPDGITHSFVPPGAALGPPGSVHLGAPAYPAPGTQHPGSQYPGSQHPGSQYPGSQHPGSQYPGSQHPGTAGVPPAYGPGPSAAFGTTSALGSGVSAPTARATQLPVAGDRIGDYTLVRELARGGMGVVYEANDINLGRRVALKLLLSQDLADDNVLVRRFLTEARELSNLSHPNIAGVYGASRDANGRHYMAMEFLEGEELKAEIVRDGSIEPQRAAEIVLKLARALSHAHGAGVLHRDIKPSNVIVTEAGEPKLVDFGLARNVEDQRERLTKTGEIMGTPAYMPPEQAGGEKSRVGPLADVYSLGATLYHMLAGEPPFRGTSVMNLINKVLSEEPKPPSSHNEGIPSSLEAICLKAMEKDIEERYESAGAFAQDLERFLGPRGEVSAKARGPIGRALRWASRKGAIFVGGGLALLGVGVAVAAVLIPGDPPPPPSPTPVFVRPSVTPTPSAAPKVTSKIIVRGDTFAGQESIQVLRAWGLAVSPQGLQFRGNRGEGPDLYVPFRFQGRRLALKAKLQVHYLTRGTELLVRLIGTGPIDSNGRPGGPPVFEASLGSRARKVSHEHGWSLRWVENKRLRGTAVDFGYTEHKKPGPFELELSVDFTREGAELSVGDGLKTQIPCRIPSGEYRLQVATVPFYYTPDDQSKGRSIRRQSWGGRLSLTTPGLSKVVVKGLLLEAEGDGSLAALRKRGDWPTVGDLGRQAAAPRADPGPIASELADLCMSGYPLVRNESIFLRAVLRARAGQAPEAKTAFAQFYRVNNLQKNRGDFDRGRLIWYQDTFVNLDAKSQVAFAGGYAEYFRLPDEAKAVYKEGISFHPLVAPPKGEAKLTNPPEALMCLLLARERGVKVDPFLLGTAWLFHGDLEKALEILGPLAEEGHKQAPLYAGMTAYLLRDYERTYLLWSRALKSDPKCLKKKPWDFRWARTKRVLGR